MKPSSGMVSLIRKSVQSTFDKTAMVTTRTIDYSQNNMGNPGYSEQSFDVPCRLGTVTPHPRENTVGDQWQAESLWMLTVPYGTSIPDTAIIEIDDTTYEVVTGRSPQSYEYAGRYILRKRGI